MKKGLMFAAVMISFLMITATGAYSFFGVSFKAIKPVNGVLKIPVKQINDGKAHYFKTMADDGIMVGFFTLKSRDGVIRAAIDACDVCFKSGKGYVQEGDYMVCTNCGQRFLSTRINVVKGGCNPAPLERRIEGAYLAIKMEDINKNSWYCKFKKL